MIIVGVLYFIIGIFLVLNWTKYSWLNQFIFMMVVLLIFHIIMIVKEAPLIDLVILNFMAFSFLLTVVFAMVIFKTKKLPAIKNKFIILLSTIFVLAIMIIQFFKDKKAFLLAPLLEKTNQQISVDFISDWRVFFLQKNLLVNFYGALMVFLVSTFLMELLKRKKKER